MTGTGSRIFDEIRASSLPALAVPGMYRDSPFLDPLFRRLYSHCGAPDKLCSTYASYRYLRQMLPAPYLKEDISFINADVGANTVSTMVVSGKVAGAVDACCGACGLSMGPLDLETIRKIEQGALSPTEAFERGGVFKGRIMEFLGTLGPGEGYHDEIIYEVIGNDPHAEERIRALAFSVAMELKGLSVFSPVDAAIISGAGADICHPVSFVELLGDHLPDMKLFALNHYSASRGAALMARSIHRAFCREGEAGAGPGEGQEGRKISILGVGVNTGALRRVLSKKAGKM